MPTPRRGPGFPRRRAGYGDRLEAVVPRTVAHHGLHRFRQSRSPLARSPRPPSAVVLRYRRGSVNIFVQHKCSRRGVWSAVQTRWRPDGARTTHRFSPAQHAPGRDALLPRGRDASRDRRAARREPGLGEPPPLGGSAPGHRPDRGRSRPSIAMSKSSSAVSLKRSRSTPRGSRGCPPAARQDQGSLHRSSIALEAVGLCAGDVMLVSSGRTVYEAAQAELPALPNVAAGAHDRRPRRGRGVVLPERDHPAGRRSRSVASPPSSTRRRCPAPSCTRRCRTIRRPAG